MAFLHEICCIFCFDFYHFLIIFVELQSGSDKTTVITFGYGSKDSMMMNQSNFSFLIAGQSMC